jgi:hypothetical protein
MRSLPVVIIIYAATWTQDVTAEKLPDINFDVSRVVSCVKVTPEFLAPEHSSAKLLEIRLRTSCVIGERSEGLIQELFLVVESPAQTIRIIDCFPKTTVLTEYATPIEVSENRENANNAALSISPVLELAGKASLNAGLSDRSGATRRTSKLPPQQLVIASGTQNRQTAAYFKFKSSSQTVLEGTRELRLTIQVPDTWRADLLHVRCLGWTAVGNRPGMQLSRSDFTVPIYHSGDTPAKNICDEFVMAENQLQTVATVVGISRTKTHQDLVSKVASFLKKELFHSEKKNPTLTDWLPQLIFSNRSIDELTQEQGLKLDSQIQNAIRRFQQCRSALLALNR